MSRSWYARWFILHTLDKTQIQWSRDHAAPTLEYRFRFCTEIPRTSLNVGARRPRCIQQMDSSRWGLQRNVTSCQSSSSLKAVIIKMTGLSFSKKYGKNEKNLKKVASQLQEASATEFIHLGPIVFVDFWKIKYGSFPCFNWNDVIRDTARAII